MQQSARLKFMQTAGSNKPKSNASAAQFASPRRACRRDSVMPGASLSFRVNNARNCIFRWEFFSPPSSSAYSSYKIQRETKTAR